MSQKKKSKPKRGVVSKAPKMVKSKDFDKGFFVRNKDILPPETVERTRVKTFIVEKPIIIHDKPQHITMGEEPMGIDRIFNSKKSRYHKKKFVGDYEEAPQNDDSNLDDDSNISELEEETPASEGQLEGDEQSLDNEVDTSEDVSGDAVESGEEDLGDEPGGDITDEDFVKKKHARSRGLFVNIWWKKAIIWAVLIWVIVLGFELLLQYGNFVQVDLTRQWWFLLAGLIVICMVYFRFVDGKLKI